MINYHFPETWTVKNLHNKANRYIRRWLSIPISLLKVKQLIIALKLPSDIYRLKQIAIRNISKSSKDQSMRDLFEISGMKNIRNDSVVKRSANALKMNS